MLSALVVAMIRAAASQYADGVRMFWLFGASPSDPIMRKYKAALRVRYPKLLRPKPPRAITRAS